MLLDDCYISYLNLDHRTDRREWVEDEFRKHGIIAERTRGKLPQEYDMSLQKYQVMVNRTAGALACYEGQLSIMRKAMELNKNAGVFEDDVQLCSDFMKRIEYITKFTETHEWDIIWLGGTFHCNPSWWHTGTNSDLPYNAMTRDAELTDDPRMIRTYGSFCTYAYIVNKNSIRKVLSQLHGWMPLSMGIDWTMIAISPLLKTFAFVPGCIKQRDNMSDIGKGITIFSGFSKLGPYWWQDKMEDFDPTTFNWGEAANK